MNKWQDFKTGFLDCFATFKELCLCFLIVIFIFSIAVGIAIGIINLIPQQESTQCIQCNCNCCIREVE